MLRLKKNYLVEVHEDRVYNVTVKATSAMEAEQEALAEVGKGELEADYVGKPRVISAKVKKGQPVRC